MEHPSPSTGSPRSNRQPFVQPPPRADVAPGELFRFKPGASNPELWRTTVPLVVRQRCGRHKGLVATWTAIHWLIVIYAGTGRRAFGMREIAREAGVGRNELAGASGHIQRLVGLGLLMIVGYEQVPGMKERRPIYQVDLVDLERQSIELVPNILREHHLPPPPRPAPDPRQLALFADEPPSGTGAAPPPPANGAVAHSSLPVGGPATHGNGTVAPNDRPLNPQVWGNMHGNGTVASGSWPASERASRSLHGNGTGASYAEPPSERPTHGNGTARAGYRHRGLQTGQPRTEPGQITPENGTVGPDSVTDHARFRDMEREKEREKERASEITRAPDFIHQLVAATTSAVLAALKQQGIAPAPDSAPHSIDAVAQAPAGQPALRASASALWRGDRAEVPSRELEQLALLASTYDGTTGGFGAYWLSRAILLADTCLTERGRPLSLTYVRSMLRRWERDSSWGSDLDEPASGAAAPAPAQQPRRPTAVTNEGTAPADDALVRAAPIDPDHPAIVAYHLAFGRPPNSVQAAQMATNVSDLAIWQRVLTEWLANGWQQGAVAKMIDRYRKEAGLPPPASDEPLPRVTTIHMHPGLDREQRKLWIQRFRGATTVAEKRAILARLHKEHPL